MSSTRVVVTGLGTTSPVGGDVPSTWDALVNGRSGVRYLTDDWAEELPVKIAGRIAVAIICRVWASRVSSSMCDSTPSDAAIVTSAPRRPSAKERSAARR